MVISFIVLGECAAQGRPRVAVRGKHATVYDPAKSRDYKQYIRLVASQHAPEAPLIGPLDVEIKIYKAIPKAFSKKRHREAQDGLIRPITKPDIDNYAKSVKDALSGVIWRDDSQVTDLRIGKWYSNTPRVEITVRG